MIFNPGPESCFLLYAIMKVLVKCSITSLIINSSLNHKGKKSTFSPGPGPDGHKYSSKAKAAEIALVSLFGPTN